MPEPIQANRSFYTYDGDLEEPANSPSGPPEPVAEAEGASEHVQDLVSSYSAQKGNTNAERAAQKELGGSTNGSGKTENGSLFAGTASMYGSKAGLTLEVGSMSAQFGASNEVQVGTLRASYTGENRIGTTTVSAEVLCAQASLGTRTREGADGSILGAGVSVVGFEVTHRFGEGGANSVTVGTAKGPALEASSGDRDIDNDGFREWCLRVGTSAGSAGFCVESPRGWFR